MTDDWGGHAPRWARFGCGALLGSFLGLLLAPRLQRWVRFFGVDPYSVGPAIVIIACAGVLGGVILVRSKLWR